MKKFLPLLLFCLFFFAALLSPTLSYAQTADQGPTPQPGAWVVDPEVTFIGKVAARAGKFLDWTLRNYNWVCVQRVANPSGVQSFQCDDTNNPIQKYWSLIMIYIVVPMLFIVLLGSAVVIIITRGRGLSVMRFIPRFIAVVVLIVFSYAIVQFFYQFSDVIQGFFLRSKNGSPCPPDCISQADLLFVGWNYEKFEGIRRVGDFYAESAYVSLLLTKLTALTYFVMVFILLIRKIILWFFIIVSPVFPILLMYAVTRNTGKIWIGEFFRWLLYAPLFAILLKGLVYLWVNDIPLFFKNPDINKHDKIVFPTAVNILLGGPKQTVTVDNSVNLTETFALYVVALIMLWTVILLPWILLQIFLEYAANFTADNTVAMRTMVNMLNKQPVVPGGPSSAPPVVPGASVGLTLPFSKKFSIPQSLKMPSQPAGVAKELPLMGKESLATGLSASKPGNVSQLHAQTLAVSNLSLPRMRDVARFETKMLSRNKSEKREARSMVSTLQKIANPAAITNPAERTRFTSIREKLVTQKEQGNVLASAILSAALNVSVNTEKAKAESQQFRKVSSEKVKNVLSQIANPASANTVDRSRMSRLNEVLKRESSQNNSNIATAVLGINGTSSTQQIEKVKEQLLQAKEKSDPVASAVYSTIANSSVSSTKGLQSVISNTSSTAELQTVLQQIAHPEIATNSIDRESFTQLHETLVQESKENNNQLATSILSISSQTSTTEIQKIQESLVQAKEGEIASSVISTVTKGIEEHPISSTGYIKTVLMEGVGNSASELHQSLQKASKEGNQLASALLTVNDRTPVAQIADLEQKITTAKAQGVPFAQKIAELSTPAPKMGVPVVNNVQTVNKEEYEEVKKMWTENYKNSDVPEGIVGTRTEWIKDDIAKINETIGFLSSSDQQKVAQGLDNVSEILPVLMVGGFSQNEIVSYLKAKLEAANEVQKILASEEEQKVAARTKHTQTAQTMAATIEEEGTSPHKETNETEETKEPLKDVLAEQEQAEAKVTGQKSANENPKTETKPENVTNNGN